MQGNVKRGCMTVTLLAALTAGGHSAANADTAHSRIAVFEAHYTAAGRGFADLSALEATVRSARPAAIDIVACEPGALRAWLAAAERFNDLRVHLYAADSATVGCGTGAVAMPASQPLGAALIDDARVRRYWQQVQP